MKVLITTGIFPPEIGGPATFIERLAADLVDAGFNVCVLTYGSPIKKERSFCLKNVSKKWPAFWRHCLFALKTFWLARQSDIVYTTDLYSPGYFSMLAVKFWRKKLVVRFAGDSAWETALNLGLTDDDILIFQKKQYTPFIEKIKARRAKIVRSADKIVAVSEFIKNLAIIIGAKEEKIEVIYNAVDFLDKLPARQKPNRPILVTACRLVPWKGVDMLIRVVAKLKQKYPAIIFEILGDGPELPKIKELSRRLNLDENIKFRGRVSEEESHNIFASSTIFVLNTNYEGFPHSVLNAMRCGLPVITTPVGGNLELIKNNENGLLVNYNDETAWEKTIERLLNNEDLQAQFRQNGQKTLEKFKWSKLVEKTIAIFRTL